MQYRLIALDLDGTLLNSRKVISPRTRAALQAAQARGVVTVISTGRAVHSARAFSTAIGGVPTICCNGAAIMDEKGELLVTRTLQRPLVSRLIDLSQQQRFLVECYTAQGIYLDRPLEQVRAYLRWVRPALPWSAAVAGLLRVWRTNRMYPVRNLAKWAARPGAPAVLKLMVIGKREPLQALAEQIRREMPGVEVTSSGSDNLEIMADGVSKGTALEALGARLKIPRDAMIACGDSDNDREMLTYAGLGVAMGNAHPEIKALADRVTGTCDEHGVAQVIEELCLT